MIIQYDSINKQQIDQWLRDGFITQKQANKILTNNTHYHKERLSNKFITGMSVIGSTLLAIGAILFIISNWTSISNIIKILIFSGSTFGAYWIGYYLQYRKQNLPKVGASLILLGTLLFGASIFLIAQIYHIKVNSHILVLIWLLGILPFVYKFSSPAITTLAALLFYIWIGLLLFKESNTIQVQGPIFKLPILYLISGIIIFGIGTMHYFSKKLKNIAQTYRLIGLKTVIASTFFLTFKFFTGHHYRYKFFSKSFGASKEYIFGLIILSILAIILAVIALIFNPVKIAAPEKANTNIFENLIALGLIVFSLIFFFFPIQTNIYVLLFNLIFMGIIFILFYLGYQRENMQLINIGIGCFIALAIVRYFDFFWNLLPQSYFFIIGGLTLLLSSITLERYHRKLKTKFTTAPAAK